jgi:hypothetical protein
MHADVDLWGVRSAAAIYATTALWLVWRLATATAPRRRVLAPVLAPVIVFLAFAAAAHVHAWDRGFLSNDPLGQALWLGQAAALAGIAAGVAWERVRARRTRAALARLVIQLASSPRPGGLRGLLAIALGDPDLGIVYPAEGGGWIDAAGRPASAPPTVSAEVTRLVRGRAVVAVILHRSGLLEDPRLVAEIQRAARLALDHERLQANLASQLARLRASRTRIATAADEERRCLERNLHDGAQQGLVRLTLTTAAAGPALAPARDELRATLDELRTVAHGIFPAVLADQGLAAAVISLAEWNPIVSVGTLPEQRASPEAEFAAYFCAAGLARVGGRTEIAGAIRDDRLVLVVRVASLPAETAIEVEDRIGALDGRVKVVRGTEGSAHIRIELPCA